MQSDGDARQSGHEPGVAPISGVYDGLAPGIFSSITTSLGASQAVHADPATRARREADLADQLHGQGRCKEAMEHFGSAMALQPRQGEYQFRFACSAWASGKLDLVQSHLLEARRLSPRHGCIVQALAMRHLHQCENDEAIRQARAALALEPAGEDAIITFAEVLNGLSRSEEAYAQLKPLMDRGLNSAFLGRTLAKIAMKIGHEEQAIAIVQRILASPDVSPNDKSQLHSALCPVLEKMRRYDEAFTQARLAKEVTRPPYDPAIVANSFAACIRYFSRRRFEVLPRSTCDTCRPVFIVGMPRSGTSLVEQILASHPSIFGAGELTGLPDLLQSRVTGIWADEEAFPGCFDHLSIHKANQLADEYLKTLAGLNSSARYVVDKMPQNFIYLGAIQILFPQARVIHCIRDPRDTCLSCYMTPFASGQEYTHDVSQLAHYYREYERLMAHWKETLELPMLEVAYEEVVGDLDKQTRRILNFLDLPWDEHCASFHETRRPVSTASREQVRQPIYRTSIGRWRHYQKYIPDFLALVDPNRQDEIKNDPSIPSASDNASGQTAMA